MLIKGCEMKLKLFLLSDELNSQFFSIFWMIFSFFDWVRKSNAIELSRTFVQFPETNQTQSFDSVRLGSMKFDLQT